MKRLRAFLLICLMLTVPLQAMAGKVLLCESLHATASSAVDTGKHAMHGHHTNSDDHKHHGHHDFLAVSPDMNHADHHVAMTDEHGSAETHSGSCNMCSSCSVGSMAMTMPEYRMQPSDVASSGVFHFAFHIPEFAPELPDDPPRA